FLVAQGGPLNGQRWAILSELLIGRDERCDIVIPDRQVSRHHARVSPTAKGIQIEDLESKNGTHVNGNPIFHPTLLQDGDIIQIALAQVFYFLSSDATLPLEEPSLLASPHPTRALRLDKRSRRVWIRDQEILPPLSLPQYTLLEVLYDHPDQVVSRAELIEAIWGEKEAVSVSDQALDALVRRLRQRLSEADPEHEYIQTVRGHGLRLNNPHY
ncbi:MAG: FHA domain-containing protein, partial [Anaerolineales bacterium]|nr:FHA domain-containing protein [Anaerolineales bacterium]MDW8447986.1 FHA domain-containing protein [Anaerolineales bacterium]